MGFVYYAYVRHEARSVRDLIEGAGKLEDCFEGIRKQLENSMASQVFTAFKWVCGVQDKAPIEDCRLFELFLYVNGVYWSQFTFPKNYIEAMGKALKLRKRFIVAINLQKNLSYVTCPLQKVLHFFVVCRSMMPRRSAISLQLAKTPLESKILCLNRIFHSLIVCSPCHVVTLR